MVMAFTLHLSLHFVILCLVYKRHISLSTHHIYTCSNSKERCWLSYVPFFSWMNNFYIIILFYICVPMCRIVQFVALAKCLFIQKNIHPTSNLGTICWMNNANKNIHKVFIYLRIYIPRVSIRGIRQSPATTDTDNITHDIFPNNTKRKSFPV